MEKSPVPAAIRSIRTRLGESMRKFADRLGVTNPTISLYEAGKIVPSRSMLLLIYRYAETPAEKAALSVALGGPPESLEPRDSDADAALRGALRNLRLKERDDLASRAIWERLAEQVGRLAERSEVPLWLVETLNLWVLYRDLPGSRKEFDAAYLSLSRRLELLAPSTVRASALSRPAIPPEVAEIRHGRELQAEIREFRTLHREPAEAGHGQVVSFKKSDPRYAALPLRIMAKCPQEGGVFWTGFETSQKNFETGGVEGMRAKCPHCGSTHILGMSDVFLAAPTP